MENHNYEKLPKQEIINETSVNETLMTSSDKSDDVICELVPVKEEPKRPKIKCRKSYTLKEKLECLGK